MLRKQGANLILGVNGFIGSAVARRILREGGRVVGVIRKGSSAARIADLKELEIIEVDRLERDALRQALHRARPTVVYNLAAYGVHAQDQDPDQMIEANIKLIADLIHAVHETNRAFIIHIGSCFEYGATPPGARMSESDPVNPFSVYGASKAASVILAKTLSCQLQVGLATLRLFGVYGPGEAEDRLVPYLINRLLASEPVDLTAGHQERDLLFIEDVAEAISLAGRRFPQVRGEDVFNVCSGKAVTVRDVGETLARLTGRSPALLCWGARGSRANEPTRIVGDNSRFSLATGWRSRTSLTAGLEKTIRAIEQKIGAAADCHKAEPLSAGIGHE